MRLQNTRIFYTNNVPTLKYDNAHDNNFSIFDFEYFQQLVLFFLFVQKRTKKKYHLITLRHSNVFVQSNMYIVVFKDM